MGLNEEILTGQSEEMTPKKKINKKKVIYTSVFTFLAVVLFIIGAGVIYTSLNLESVYFTDFSMAPTINKSITNEGTELIEEDYVLSNGNVVEYGFVDPRVKKQHVQRFQIVLIGSKKEVVSNYTFPTYRVVGLPSENVKLDYEGNLYINDKLIDQPIPKEYLALNINKNHSKPNDFAYETKLEDDEFYLLKDNRKLPSAKDSRHYGPFNFDEFYGVVKTIQGVCTINGSRCINRTLSFPRFI